MYRARIYGLRTDDLTKTIFYNNICRLSLNSAILGIIFPMTFEFFVCGCVCVNELNILAINALLTWVHREKVGR